MPLVSLFETALGDAEAAGRIRPGIARHRVAGVVLEAIMFNAFSTTISGPSSGSGDLDSGEELWDLVFNGIRSGSPR